MKESEKNEKPIASTSGIQNKKGDPISLLDSEDSCSIQNKKGGPISLLDPADSCSDDSLVFRLRKEAPLVYWTLRIVVVFRIRKEAPLVYWTLRIVVVMTLWYSD